MHSQSIMSAFVILAVAISVGVSTATNEFDLETHKRCDKLASEYYCGTDGAAISRASLDIVVECNDAQQAQYLANYCSLDAASGTYCRETSSYYHDIFRILFSACGPSIYGNATCSPECKTRLQTIRDDLGCCINAALNYTSNVIEFLRPAFGYSLWSSCQVEPVTTTCTGMLPYTLPNEATSQSNCGNRELQTRLLELFCAPSVLNNLRAALAGDAGCESYLQYAMITCSLHENGTFCLATNEPNEDVNKFIIPLMTNCNSSQPCSTRCNQYLAEYRNTRGCCVNAIYNSTYTLAGGFNYTTGSLFEDDSLFNLCEVETPPLTCRVPTDESLPLKSFSCLILLLWVVSLYV